LATVFSRHSSAESVGALALEHAWLKGTLHNNKPVSDMALMGRGV